MNYYERAQELNEETIANRRYFHTNAEVGLDMPKAKAYVMKKLTEYGLEPKECGYGVTATLGHGGKCIMLRADMDALPMPEESGEPEKKLTHVDMTSMQLCFLQQLRCLKRMSLNWKEQLNLCSSQLRRTSWEARI